MAVSYTHLSFIATSNQKDLLTDPSGSRRFICIEVTGVIYTNRPIDYEQLYAQAMYELEHLTLIHILAAILQSHS